MYERSWVRFLSGTQILSLSHTHNILNVPSFLIIYPVYLYVTPRTVELAEKIVGKLIRLKFEFS